MTPDRKELRLRLRTGAAAGSSTPLALALSAVDCALFMALIAGAVWVRVPAAKVLLGLAAGFMIGRLFILGHDACHQSFTPHRRLNRWLGRLLFLPSLTPYSLWEAGHNVVHHGYTNLKGTDFVWAPASAGEFAALSPWRRTLERIYRSGWAPWLYYLVEIWWARMYFPSRRYLTARRPVFLRDCLLVTAAAATWIGGLAYAAQATGQSIALTITAGFAVPFLFWNGMIGFVVYLHHTHTGVAWYRDKRSWSQSSPFITTTVHITFPRRVLGLDMGGALHHIMEHTAHHLDMGIPLYRLRDAQRLLETLLPGRIVLQPFSWRWYFDSARRCKLYDFDTRRWTDFSGTPTTAPAA